MNGTMKVLSDDDMKVLNKRERTYWIALSAIIGILSLMCFYIIPANDGWEVALYVGAAMFVVVIIVAIMFYRLAAKTRQDKADAVKICGEFKVARLVKKGEYSTQWFLIINTGNKQHELFIKESVYNQIVPTNVMYVEFAPHSDTILCLKDGTASISLR